MARTGFDETPDAARNAILEKKKFTLKSVLSAGAQHYLAVQAQLQRISTQCNASSDAIEAL